MPCIGIAEKKIWLQNSKCNAHIFIVTLSISTLYSNIPYSVKRELETSGRVTFSMKIVSLACFWKKIYRKYLSNISLPAEICLKTQPGPVVEYAWNTYTNAQHRSYSFHFIVVTGATRTMTFLQKVTRDRLNMYRLTFTRSRYAGIFRFLVRRERMRLFLPNR